MQLKILFEARFCEKQQILQPIEKQSIAFSSDLWGPLDGLKRYFMYTLFQTKPYDLGRYIVFPHVDKTKTFYGIGSKRNIDLDNGKVFGIFDGDVYIPQDIIYATIRTLDSHVENLQLFTPFFNSHTFSQTLDFCIFNKTRRSTIIKK